jgi:hypothetical protein
MHPVSDAIELFRELYWWEHPKIEDITAGDYLYERLVDLGLIKKIIPKFTLVIKDIEFT